MKRIKETWNLNELLEVVGLELPVEVPEFGFSLEYKERVLHLKAHFDEEGFEKTQLSEKELKAWLLKLQAAFILYQDEIANFFDDIKSEIVVS